MNLSPDGDWTRGSQMHLRLLDLRDNKISDAALLHLANLRIPTTLRLGNADITDASLIQPGRIADLNQ
jgi:hypothetical protein